MTTGKNRLLENRVGCKVKTKKPNSPSITMNIRIDHEEFGKRQIALIRLIAHDVRSRLEKMGLGDDQELVENLVFDIAAILDGSRDVKSDGELLRPFVTFADDRKGERLLAVEGGSWLHEICSGIVEKMFEDNSPA